MSMNTIPMQAIHNMQQQQLLNSITMMNASNDTQCSTPKSGSDGSGFVVVVLILLFMLAIVCFSDWE